ncbi:hypothetical protein BG005_006241 [Podila minutissima]|nr:hypothetical protein BG005_006241 [Podila minutissima]
MPSNLLPLAVRELATLTLGISFDADLPIRMTALQYSVVCYSLALATGAAEENFSIVQTLLKATRKEDLNYDCFGNNSNVVHLAAFLDLYNIIELLILHGADASHVNGQGLSACDIMDAVKAAKTVFPSISTSDDSSETGSIILETKILDYFGFQGDEDQGNSEDDVEDDSLTAVNRSWDSSDYMPKLDPDADENYSTTAFEYTAPRLYHLSFDNDKTPPTRTYLETSAILPLDYTYLSHSISNTQTHGTPDHDQLDPFDPESFLVESSDEDDLYSTSLLYQICQPRSPVWDRSSPLNSAMRHDRRFGLPSATYFDYLSTLCLIPRSPARSDSARKTVRWEEAKEIIVFRRHLHESTDPESDDEAEEEEIAAFQRTSVYQEHGLDPAYSLDECASPYDAVCPMTPFEASGMSVEEDEEEDRLFDSVSSGNNGYGLSQTNASTNDLQSQYVSSAKASVLDRPLPRIPVGQESETSTLPPTSKRRNSLQRRTPPPPKLSLDTQEPKSTNPVMVWQSQPESGIAFSAIQDPRMSTALKSPPPQSLPKSLFANAPPMLARLLRKFPEGSSSPPSARARTDTPCTTIRQVPGSDNKKESLAPPRPFQSLCRSMSETNLAQHVVDKASVSSSVIDLGCFEKELPFRPGTWSKGAQVMSALRTSLKFLSPPPSPSLIASSPNNHSLNVPWLPRQCLRSARPLSLVLPRPLDSTLTLSQVLDKMPSSSESNEAISNQPGVGLDLAQFVSKGTSPLVNTTSTRNAIDLLPPSVASRLLRSDSNRARSPQVYPHQQCEEPTTTIISANCSSVQENATEDRIVDRRPASRQSDPSDNRSNKNSDWYDRKLDILCKVEVPQSLSLQTVTKDLQVSNPATPGRVGVSCTARDIFSYSVVRKRSLTRSTPMTRELTLRHLHDHDTSNEMELIHGVLHTAVDECDDMAHLGSALINLQGIAQGLPIQRYIVRQSKEVQLFSDRALDDECQARKPRFNVWTFRSALPTSPRVTLSNCESPSLTKTGVLFLRIKSFADFSLPVPTEGAKVSIRIDTGFEKVDTDYIPLEDIEMLFNQDPVTPDLALTITLHLMQSPHLHPRWQPPPLTANISECINLEDPLLQNHSDHRNKRALHDSGITFMRSPNSTLSWRATAATISSRTSRSLASMFQKQYAQTNRSSRCSSEDDGTNAAFAGVGSIYPSSLGESSSANSPNSVPRQSMVSLASATKSTIAKWKRNILTPSSRKKKFSSLSTSAENDQVPEQDNAPAIHYPGPRARLDASLHDLPVLVQHSDSVIDYSSSPSLPQLSMEQIRGSETPLQILSRHTLFEDENCIARSGIMFEDLRAACENQIVRVEFLSINNWMDRTDYSRKSTPSQERSRKQEFRGNDRDDDSKTTLEDLAEGDFVVGKILTSLCFLPGQAMDPEDALFEDENRIPTEPQNMLECQQGLHYFQWQSRTTYQGSLFYMTESNVWVEGLFRIVGSKLWRCNYRPNSDMQGHNDENLEIVAYLDLESVNSIETNLGVFATRPSSLKEQDLGQMDALPGEMNFGGEQVPFYAVNNSFRMHMTSVEASEDNSNAKAKNDPRVQDFYARTPESGQEWVTALMTSCQNRPPTPYWLHIKEDQ